MSTGLANRRQAAAVAAAPKTKAMAPAPVKRKPTVKVIVPVGDKLLLTIEEFAAVIGVGRAYACRLIYEGRVRTVTLGRLRRVPRQAAEEYVKGLPVA
jgi:excisionase family DNA binding protein